MYPNQQTPPVYSTDYLNQIAPQGPKKRWGLSRMQLMIAGALALAVLIVIILAIVLNSGGSSKPEQQLAAKLIMTEKLTDDAKDKLKSSTLRTLNSNLKINLTQINRNIVDPLKKDKIDVASLDAKVVASESGTDILSRLEDARLNVNYDRTYAREIAYQLELIVALMRQINTSTDNADLKTFLDGAYTNLQPTQKSFEDFNATDA